MKKTRRKVLLKVIIVAILIFASFEVLLIGIATFNAQSMNNDLYKKGYSVQNQIENIFQSTITISDGYLSYVTSNIDVTKEESESFLEHLLFYDDNFIRNIALVENTTIIYNYPYEENKTSIGADLSTVEGQIEETLFVKNNLEPIFFGPVELVQGGKAFLTVIPVLDGNDYFGQVISVIDADFFIETIQHEADMQKINLKITDLHTSEEVLLIGDSLEGEIVNSIYTNKYFSWNLEFSYRDTESTLLMDILTRLMVIFVITIISYFSYRSSILSHSIMHNAIHDSLTNDFNRAKFVKDYNSNEFANKLIAFADVNKFKLLNDTLGHLFGDWCLIQLSNKLNDFGYFTVYRISGDEFILVSNIEMTTDEFLTNIDSAKFEFYNEELQQDVDIELSIGVLEKLNSNINLETLLMYLDYAMYDAKKDGKTFSVVSQKLMKHYDETKVIEQQLIEDVKKNRLIPYYQPIINLDEGKIEGFEVLSRWSYKGEIRSAGMFINIVKKIKYVDLVDQNLFNRIQEDYAELSKQSSDFMDMTISLNLSAETLMIMNKDNRRFDKFVKDRSMPIDRINFEISEDMNLGLISIETLRYMQNKGYSITVDDFGAGVSKLSDVLSGELRTIKTDKSLLPSKQENDKKVNGFYTIISAIKASGSTICVEGVETLTQLEMSIRAGCKLAQGYLFGKPMPKEEIISYIREFDFTEFDIDM